MNKLINTIRLILVFTFLFFFICCEKDEINTQGKSTANFNESLTYGTVKDIEGNLYKTIKIGNQTWMAENLRVTRYNNGDLLPHELITGNFTFWDLFALIDENGVLNIEGAYGSYGGTNDLDSIATFGLLYNWAVISDSRGIAPEGWHIPTKDEWDTLITTLGGYTIETELKLLESAGAHWYYMNLGNNSSGFTALPAGQFNMSEFYGMGYWTAWWTKTEIDGQLAFAKQYGWDYPEPMYSFPKHMGLSIRCIKDEITFANTQ